MKFISIFSLLLSFQSLAANCVTKDLKSKILVLPQYEATVNYFFGKSSKEGFATVSWKLNEDVTRDCFEETKTKHPGSLVVIPRSEVSHLNVKVLGGMREVPLQIYPQANGHFFGDADSVKVPSSMKKELELALKKGESMVEVSGDLRFVTTVDEPKILAEVSCTNQGDEGGVLNMLKRMKELEKEVLLIQPKGKINLEEVMQEFLATCVSFKNVEASSFHELEQKQRVTSTFNHKLLPIVGVVPVTKSEALSAVAIQQINLFDL